MNRDQLIVALRAKVDQLNQQSFDAWKLCGMHDGVTAYAVKERIKQIGQGDPIDKIISQFAFTKMSEMHLKVGENMP